MPAVLCGEGAVLTPVLKSGRLSGNFTGSNEYETDDAGMSGSSVLRCEDKILWKNCSGAGKFT